MARRCHIDGCGKQILPALASEGVCLDHFVQMVIERADSVRARCVESEFVDEETLAWLLGDAPNAVHALSKSELDRDPSDNEKLLELLLCLANLQDYITHHSLRVKWVH
ncbi:MAG: hypothetical protein ACYDD2_12655 [Candidatus Acidiferrales bacterium]